MKTRNLFIFIAVTLVLSLILTIKGSAQDPDSLTLQVFNNSGGLLTLNSSHVSGDFGRRECCTNKWHKGVDVTFAGGDGDLGYAIRSLNSGNIEIIRSAQNYKYIVIDGPGDHDFGYGHIFEDGVISQANGLTISTGDFVMKRLNAPHQQYACIIYQDAVDTFALTDAPLPAGAHTYAVTHGGITYNHANGRIRNTVDRGQKIAPLGNSGGFVGNAHIHLYGLNNPLMALPLTPDNTNDPMFHVDHIRAMMTTNLDSIHSGFGNNTGTKNHNFNLKGRVTMTNIAAGASGQYPAGGAILALNEVKIFTKFDYEHNDSFRLIKGGYFQSKMVDGSRKHNPGDLRYPAHNRPVGNTTGGDGTGDVGGNGVDIANKKRSSTPIYHAGYGDYRKTGIKGCAYTGGSGCNTDPVDHYHFNDFPTRIAKSDNFGRNNLVEADEITEARYPDGRYTFMVRAYDIFQDSVDNSADMNDRDTLLIDNFQPYIKSVNIAGGSDLVYDGKWELSGTGAAKHLEFNPGQGSAFVGAVDPSVNGAPNFMYITVETSEPMQNLYLQGIEAAHEIDTNGVAVLPPPLIPTNSPLGSFSKDKSRKLWFFLLTKQVYSNPDTRKFLGARYMLNFTGTDLAGNELLGYFRPGYEGLGNYPADNSLNDPVDIPVTNIPKRATATTWSTASTSTHYDRIHGFIIGHACHVGGNKNNAKANTDCLDFEFSATNGATHPSAPAFLNLQAVVDASNTGTAPYIFTWDFGNGTTVTSLPQMSLINSQTAINYSAPGVYTVSVTVEDSDGLIRAKVKQDYIVVGDPVIVDFSPTITQTIQPGGQVSFTPNVSGGNPPYLYFWDFGNGNFSSASNPAETYNDPGTYTVELSAVDQNGDVGTKTRIGIVQVVDNTLPVIADFTYSIIGNNVSFTDIVSGYNFPLYLWDFGDGSTSTAYSPFHIYANGGTFTVTLTVSEAGKPTSVVSHQITIAPDILPDFTHTPNVIQTFNQVTFNNTSNVVLNPPVGNNYQSYWYFGDGNFQQWSSNMDGTNTYINPGDYDVTLGVRRYPQSGATQDWISWTTKQVSVVTCFNGKWLPSDNFFNLGIMSGWIPDYDNFGGSIPDHETQYEQNGIFCNRRIMYPIALNNFDGFNITGANRIDYEYEFEVYRIRLDGSGFKSFDVELDINNSDPDVYPVVAWAEFDWDEFNDPDGDEQYFVKVTITEQGCQQSYTQEQQLCIEIDEHDWTGLFCSATTDEYEGWNELQFPVPRIIDQSVVDDYFNEEAHLFLGDEIETSGNVEIVGQPAHFKARNEIRFKSGFEVEGGNETTAKIESSGQCFVSDNYLVTEPPANPGNSIDFTSFIEDKSTQPDLLESEFRAFPNLLSPDQAITIQWKTTASEICNFKLSDINGAVVLKRELPSLPGINQTQINLSEIRIAPGTYMLEMTTNSLQFTQKIIVHQP